MPLIRYNFKNELQFVGCLHGVVSTVTRLWARQLFVQIQMPPFFLFRGPWIPTVVDVVISVQIPQNTGNFMIR
jgi:hypothetical protein